MADVSKIKLPNGTTYNIKDTISGYITANTAPVTSVNGDIGDVTITEGLEPLIGTTSTVTPQQVMTALGEGRDICITASASLDDVPLELKFTSFNRATDTMYNGMAFNVVVSQTIASYNRVLYLFELVGGTVSMEPYPWEVIQTNLATLDNLNNAVSDLWNNFDNYVPTEREVNGKALSADITLSAADVDAVPTTRKVNGHALSADVTVTASDIGVEDGAEVNQNAFSNVKVGTTTVAADTQTDTLELVAGSNVTITPDATNDKITIAATDTKYTAASAAPLMDGTAAVGSSAKYAREDHVHPTDTSRQVDLGITDVDIAPSSGLYYFVIRRTNAEAVELPTSDTLNFVWEDLGTEIDGKVSTSSVGAASGVCPLNANSKVDSQYLPSYVDDVIEAYPVSGATALSAGWLSATSGGSALTPEAGKIYVLMADSGDYSADTQFRWGGTTYVKLADGGVSSITNLEIDAIVAS